MFTFNKVLTLQGILVDAYNEPLEALKHFNDRDYYDLAVLDIRMPGINGLELYYRLREINEDIRVFFVSALDASEELVSMLPGIRADNIIKKPLEVDQFVSAVKKRLPDKY